MIALWPLAAAYARLPERARGGAFAVAMAGLAALSAFREMGPAGTAACAAVGLAVAGWLVAAQRGGGAAGAAWGVAVALLGARYWFGAPGLRQGAGLLAMSVGLWGTLVLGGLLLAQAGRGMDRMDEIGREKGVEG